MYLDQLLDIEKSAFARLAYVLIAHYGIEDHEQKLYGAALAEMGLYEADIDDAIDPAVEAAAFQSSRSRRIALLELMLLALADGHVETEEQHILDQLIAEFGFDAETLEQAWEWVRTWYDVRERGAAFLDPSPVPST